MTTDTWSEYIHTTYAATLAPAVDTDQYCPDAAVVTPRSPISAMAPSPNPNSHTTNTTTSSSAAKPNPYASVSPTYGPYAKSGRGGAGNYTWQNYPTQAPPQSTSMITDPEQGIEMEEQSSLSERQRRAKEVELREVADAIERKKTAVASEVETGRVVVMSGRGGAGNYLGSASSSLTAAVAEAERDVEAGPASGASTGITAAAAATATAAQPSPPSSTKPQTRVGYYGRGGAGNFRTFETPRTEEQEVRRVDEAKRQEEVRREVERSVGNEIGRPEGVVVREGRERT